MSYAANPRAEDQPGKPSIDPSVPQESTGPVASDSLAADSIRDHGGFSENASADVLGVRGGDSTLANEDTSGAIKLDPASSGAERERQELMDVDPRVRGDAGGVKYPEGAGDPDFHGVTSDQGYVGGPSSDRPPQGYNAETPYTTAGSYDTAPTYAATVAGNIRSEGELKPKGRNLTEGNIPEAKTFMGNVGGQYDPGRVAEREMLQKTSATAGEGVGGVRQSKDQLSGSTGQYDVLDVERADKQGPIDE